MRLMCQFTSLSINVSSNKLLEESYFHYVEKIKTIGSCYMAASGLAPDRQVGDCLVHILLFFFVLTKICPSFIHSSFFLSVSIHLCLSLSQASSDEWNHLSELVLFALAMQETLKEINRHSAQNFQLRVGKWLSSLPPTHTHSHQQWMVDVHHSLRGFLVLQT